MDLSIIAAITGSQLLNVIIWVIVAGLIFWLLSWLITYCAIPEPFSKIARVIVAVVAVVMLINALLTLAGRPFITL